MGVEDARNALLATLVAGRCVQHSPCFQSWQQYAECAVVKGQIAPPNMHGGHLPHGKRCGNV